MANCLRFPAPMAVVVIFLLQFLVANSFSLSNNVHLRAISSSSSRASNGFSTGRNSRRFISSALSATAAQQEAPRPVEKVAIIGAGISGLALAHALVSDNLNSAHPGGNKIQIDLFDSREKFDDNAGSGIQLTGGLAALGQISPSLLSKVTDAGLKLESIVSRCRPWFGGEDSRGDNDQGWKLLELNIQNAIRETFGDAENNNGLITDDGEVLAYTILRGALQRILCDDLTQEKGIGVNFGKRLCGISYSNEGAESSGITCEFDDGSSTGQYDLVVGCDGIQSAVKKYVDTGSLVPSSDAPSKSSAIYSGIRITFAIEEGDEVKGDNDGARFTQFFGNGAYALTTSYGAGKGKPKVKGAFLVYGDKDYKGPFPKRISDSQALESVKSTDETPDGTINSEDEPSPVDENADWTQDKRVTREHVSECLEVLKSTSIPGNDVANIVRNSNRFFDLGVYFHNPFSWNGWIREVPKSNNSGGLFGRDSGSNKFCVICGDAAHAMPPFLGQGANQAVQDAFLLGSKVLEYNAQVQSIGENPTGVAQDGEVKIKPDLKVLLKDYEHRRWLPTTSITAKAALLGYLEAGSGFFANFRDAFFFVMGKAGVAKKVFLDAATPKI